MYDIIKIRLITELNIYLLNLFKFVEYYLVITYNIMSAEHTMKYDLIVFLSEFERIILIIFHAYLRIEYVELTMGWCI